jgi:hypothetical protein
MPLWAEEAGWWTSISGPERDSVPEACSPNVMPLQDPLPGLKDDARPHDPKLRIYINKDFNFLFLQLQI